MSKSETKTIKQKMDELSKLVMWFESDEFTLEEAVEAFKKAEKLAAEIEADLLNLKNDIQVVKQKFDQA
jgi:exodeoxyribonuclease VII small subunit